MSFKLKLPFFAVIVFGLVAVAGRSPVSFAANDSATTTATSTAQTSPLVTTVVASTSVTMTATTSPQTSSSLMTTELQLQVLQSQLAKLQLQQTAGGTIGTVHKYKFTGFLDKGAKGAKVTALQKLLTTLGFYSGPITGKYDARTTAAVKKYQSAHGVAPKGYVGPGTRALLNSGQ